MILIIGEMMLSLLNKLGIIIILAVIISKIGIFRKLIIKKNITFMDKIFLSIVFGAIGIMGTYSSVPINGALANTRIVGVMVGALLGGPMVGFMAGLIAGGHRFLIDIGGFTAVACGVATIVEGLFGGYAHYYIRNKSPKWEWAFLLGVISEFIQMIIILLIARPFGDALQLVKIILFPMVVVNSFGIAIFIGIIENIYTEYDRIAASQAEKTLKIANLTLPYLRQGLNYEVAQKVVGIIKESVDVAAVTITNRHEILAHKGIGEDHHCQGFDLQTEATKEVIQTGQYKIINDKDSIKCIKNDCTLKSAIVVPLKERDRVVGILKLYRTEENSITSIDTELALGLAQLFSTQIELSRVEHQNKLITEAELKSLQAQINPHFLFNAINTIVSFIQFDSGKAKQLLISLAELFRKSLSNNQDMVDMDVELKHIASYLEIEKARFGDKLQVKYDIQKNVVCKLPPLILQPIVENAVVHGILPKKSGGSVTIRCRKNHEDILLEVIDDGIGMEAEELKGLLNQQSDTNCIGLMNVNRRLINLYGEEYKLQIKSTYNEGTSVLIKIPYVKGRYSSEVKEEIVA
ncbi:two-component system, LytT family, sensor histidine kinase LytS [Natronincola peptidivorans]|uniref:histidine kinase n=1 Tax=Natronincola peptidivorans TaxID=426128 RepID=A0A1I0G9S3_9FIRM|nr:sensor histidine kinase [Natronincola peptidivorans]SET67504.1 two-component system, LytT family, sensor histidine kinase LytS [Natronincola peptidivorans]